LDRNRSFKKLIGPLLNQETGWQRVHGNCRRTFAAAMLCASNMSALIPPGCAAMQRGERLHSGTTPRNGALAVIFLIPEFETTDAHGSTRIKERFKINLFAAHKLEFGVNPPNDVNSVFAIHLLYQRFIRVHPCESVVQPPAFCAEV